MSDDKRKNARLQGRYSGGDKEFSSKQKDKHSPKMSSAEKNKGEKRTAPSVGPRAQSDIDIKYDEESKCTFKELEAPKKPQEIRFIEPVVELSHTNNGISRLIYEPSFMKFDEAHRYYEVLENTTSWYDKNIVIRGVEYPQPRLVAWYGPHPYTYAGATLEASEMPKAVNEIKEKVEATLRKYDVKVELNSVLLNLYRNEKDSVAWHSDDEFSLGICPTIASVSLGTTRRFEMRPMENVKEYDVEDVIYVNLTHGSLIVMDGCMQKDWLHRVPKEYHDRGPRINLTFRTIYPLDQLPPEMPRASNWKSTKSPSEKVVRQQDPKFDEESFPPLGMEAKDKKTKLQPKENGSADYRKPAIERKSPNDSRDSKSKFVSKGNQMSVSERKSRKEENWESEMFQDVDDSPPIQNNLNKKSSRDSQVNSPEMHSSQVDFNSNVKESAKKCNTQFPSKDVRKRHSDSYVPTDRHPSPSEPVEIEVEAADFNSSAEVEPVDFNSNVEESAKLCDKQLSSSSLTNSKYQSNNPMAHQYNHKLADNQSESRDPSLTDREPIEIEAEPIETDAKMLDLGKKSVLNANAPDFVPQLQNRFDNYSLSELPGLYSQLKNEELHSFKEVMIKQVYGNDSPLNNRDMYELEVYRKLTDDDSLSNKHLKTILERICSMVQNAFYWQNDPRNLNRSSNRYFDKNSHYKHKQSYGRSQRQ